jgi:hypothetical protein
MKIFSSPTLPRVVAGISAGTTVLTLAGVATAAVLIATVSLAVLWPLLIGCACVAAIGLVILAIAGYAILFSSLYGSSASRTDNSFHAKNSLIPFLDESNSSSIEKDSHFSAVAGGRTFADSVTNSLAESQREATSQVPGVTLVEGTAAATLVEGTAAVVPDEVTVTVVSAKIEVQGTAQIGPAIAQITCPFDEGTMMALGDARKSFLDNPKANFAQWEAIWQNLEPLRDESSLAWAVEWLCKSDGESGVSLAIPHGMISLSLASKLGLDTNNPLEQQFCENILELCNRMPEPLLTHFLTMPFDSMQTPVGFLLECSSTKEGTVALLQSLDENLLTQILCCARVLHDIVVNSKRAGQILNNVEHFSLENRNKIYVQTTGRAHESAFPMIVAQINNGAYHSVVEFLTQPNPPRPVGEILSVKTSPTANLNRSVGIVLLEQINSEEREQIAQLFLSSSTTLEEPAKIVLWDGAGIQTLRFLLHLLKGDKKQRILGDALLKSIPNETLSSLAQKGNISEAAQSLVNELFHFLPSDKLSEISGKINVKLLFDFLGMFGSASVKAEDFASESTAWRLYLLSTVGIPDAPKAGETAAPQLSVDERHQLLKALICLPQEKWKYFVDNRENDLFDYFKKTATEEDGDLLLVLEVRCYPILLESDSLVPLLKILRNRFPANSEERESCVSFANSCEELMSSLNKRYEEGIKKSMLRNLAQMVHWAAGSFPTLPVHGMEYLGNVCQIAVGYTTTCGDALQTGKEYFEGSWTLMRCVGTDPKAKSQILTMLWLQDCIHGLLLHLEKNVKGLDGAGELLELAMLVKRVLCQVGKLQIDEMLYASCGTIVLNRVSRAIMKYGFPVFGNLAAPGEANAAPKQEIMTYEQLTEHCGENCPDAFQYWSAIKDMFIRNETIPKNDLIPFMLCLLYWCQKHPLDYSLQSNEGWATAFVSDIALIPISAYVDSPTIGGKDELFKDCFSNLVNELYELANANMVPLPGEQGNILQQMKERLQQLRILIESNKVNCSQAREFLHWLYADAIDQHIVVDPLEKETKPVAVLQLSDVGIERFEKLVSLCLGSAFEATARKMYLASAELRAQFNTILKDCHLA